jgi:hypothetical protein
MYVLLTFWLCLATLTFLKRQWILFSIAAALAQYTHNLAAFYLIPLAFSPIFQTDWKTLRSLTLAGFAAIIMYSPWLIHLPAQISKVTSSFWIEKPGFEKLFTLFLIYLPHLPLPNNLLLPGLLLATLTIALAAFQTYRAQKEDPQKAKSGLWLAYLSFVPPLCGTCAITFPCNFLCLAGMGFYTDKVTASNSVLCVCAYSFISRNWSLPTYYLQGISICVPNAGSKHPKQAGGRRYCCSLKQT